MMKLFNINYDQAQVWRNAMEVREAKKLALQPTTEAQEEALGMYSENVQVNQTIFTPADLGHNEEETNKIRQIYSELNTIRVFPRLAI